MEGKREEEKERKEREEGKRTCGRNDRRVGRGTFFKKPRSTGETRGWGKHGKHTGFSDKHTNLPAVDADAVKCWQKDGIVVYKAPHICEAVGCRT